MAIIIVNIISAPAPGVCVCVLMLHKCSKMLGHFMHFLLLYSCRSHPADLWQQDSLCHTAAAQAAGDLPWRQGAGVWAVAGPPQADVPGHAQVCPVFILGWAPLPEMCHLRGVQE